ncbi:MAG: type II secretion system F family protein [Actinomycetia bacterium]|nr:type II secretion system F family protein [Actinomycetes bacterium]MCL2614651.1 type II secretion system F family protein [Nocardioidaceae bacterium]
MSAHLAVSVVAVAAAGSAAGLLVQPPVRWRRPEVAAVAVPAPADGLLRRWRVPWAILAGVGAAVVVGGPLALPAGVVAAVGTWVVAGRIEPADVRRRREDVRRDLPHVVALLASALRSGAAPPAAIALVARALPGAAADRLAGVSARLELGGDPAAVWQSLGDDDVLAPLGRTLARAHRTGAPVVVEVERLGAELARRARADVEDRARAVGVRAAVPLGVCLLPAFLLLGIVPLVAGLAAAISW